MPPATSVFLRFSGPVLWTLAALCLYFAQPIFLGAEWAFAWPSTGILGIAGLALLSAQAWQARGRGLLVLALALTWVLLLALSMLVHPGPVGDAALLAAPFCGGLALALSRFSAKPERDELVLSLLLGSFWWFNILLCLIGDSKIGLFGNPNWLAASLLAALPWGLDLTWRCALKGLSLCRRILPIHHACAFAGPLALALSLPPFFVILWHCKCRMAWAALALLLTLRLILGCPRLVRRIGLVTGLVALVGLLWFFSPDGRKEIRPHLWKEAAALSLEHPLLGGGPGSFLREQPGLRTVAHGQCSNYAENCPHPHNEILSWMVQLGLPAALCGLALLAIGLIYSSGAPRWALAAMVLCALVDMPMSIGASSVLGVIFIALALRPSLGGLVPLPQMRSRGAAIFSTFVALAIFGGAGVYFRGLHSAAYLAHKASRCPDAAEAAELWRQAAEKTPDNPAYWHNAVELLADRLNQPFEAIEILKKGQVIAPDYSHFQLYAGMLAERQAQIATEPNIQQSYAATALAAHRRHLVTHPGQPEALAQWRNFCFRAGRFSDAARAQQDLLDLGSAELIELAAANTPEFASQPLLDQVITSPDQKSLQKLFSGLRGLGIVDPIAANLTPRQQEAMSQEVRLLLELKKLRQLAEVELKIADPEALAKTMLARLRPEAGSTFSFPADTLESGKASQAAAAALLQVIGILHGHHAWIARLGEERLDPWICVWECGDQALVLEMKSRKLSRVPLAQFRSQAERGIIASCPLKKWRVYLFEYPPLLLHRQQALQLAAHSSKLIATPCLQPAGTALAALQTLLGQPADLLPQGLDWEPRKQP